MKSDFVIKDPRSHTEQRLGAAATTEERLAFLNDASRRIGSTLDVERTAQELADVALGDVAEVTAHFDRAAFKVARIYVTLAVSLLLAAPAAFAGVSPGAS